ncbi:MAG: sugar nucleotide-binding protein [Candidatus Cloacimonetes bacterium]|nr:sugar nucleotide-binding protein [Candidatus Cloacimonadota bacterium]
MKIAITGANGFVGSNLISHFQSEGHEVLALVRSAEAARLLSNFVSTKTLKYSDITALSLALTGVDVLIHNAGKTKALDHDEMMDVNVEVTSNVVLAVSIMNQPIQLIYISSQAASRPSYGNIPVKESDAPAPLTSYGKSKLAAEMLIRQSCTKPYTIIRPCSVYGSGDKDFLALFKMVNKGFSFNIGKQDKLLNMIHVSELAAFIGLCLKNKAAYGEIFFATDGRVYKQCEIQSSIAKALNKKPLHITIPSFIARLAFHIGDAWGKTMHVATIVNKDKMKEIMAEGWLADPEKAIRILGWNPKPNLEKHIMETAKCYREHGWL